VCVFLEALVESKQARRMRMIAVLPTLSAPIYETLHTGLEPLEHGITSNDNLRKSNCENIFTIAKAGGLVTTATAHSFFSTLYNEDPYIPIRDQEVNDPDYDIGHPNPGIESEEVSQLSVAPSILSILGLSNPKKMNAPLIDK